jgi:hypothetical protein
MARELGNAGKPRAQRFCYDLLGLAEGNRLIALRIPGAIYEEIADARDIPMMQHPEMFNRILLRWLAAQW